MLGRLFETGRIVDCIIAFMAVEYGLLLWVRYRWRRDVRPVDIAAALGAGLCLLLALRAALTNQGVPIIAAWLGAALVAHLLDLRFRLKEQP
jgi:hypothetical protein